MNAFTGDQFGDMASLLRALGLVDENGGFVGDWIRHPEVYLKTILADAGQRDALLDFVTAARGGVLESDASGRAWIEIATEDVDDLGTLRFFLVMDDAPDKEVRLYLGLRLDAGVPTTLCRASLLFPLFRAAKNVPGAPSTPDLIGHPGGAVELSADFILSDTAPAAGEAALAGLGLLVSLPTDATDGGPVVALSLTGLQLPGETSARDLALSLTDPEALQDAGIELILAVLQAQVGANASAEIAALGRLLGLDGSTAIPDFPIEGLLTRGLDALSDWLAQTLGTAASRTAWLSALANLIGNGASATAGGISLPLGSGTVEIGLDAQPGSSGRPIVTLSLGLGFTQSGTEVALTADLVRLDLSTGDATALPDLRAELAVDVSLSSTDFDIDALVLGLALDASRRPVLVLELRDARVFTTSYDRLDLTNPDAVAAAASQAAGDALAQIIGQLGPAANLLSVALGWSKPAGASAGYPTIDIISFLGDPLGRIRSHWESVLASHTADIPQVLAALRELVTGSAGAVTGDGTDASPWLIPLDTTSKFALAVWRDAAGRLLIGFSLRFRVDDLGQRCTVLESRLRAGLVAIDLATGNTTFLPEIRVSALGRARGGGRLELAAANLRLEVDHLGILARWTPSAPLSVGLDAPDPALFLDEIALPLDIPDFSGGFGDFFGSLTAPQWEALERIGAMLALQLDLGWLRDLIKGFHWLPDPPALGRPSPFRLSLKGLFDDPGLELRGWLIRLIRGKGEGINLCLQPLARLLSGNPLAALHVEGSGSIADPYRIRLEGDAARPALALWLEPDIPIPHPDYGASLPLRRWRPGMTGLSSASLAAAVFSEFPDFDGLLPGGIDARELTDGLSALGALWRGTDGLCPPPSAPVAGVSTHLVQNQSAAAIFAAHDAAAYLGTAAPDTLVLVSTLPEGATPPTLSPAPDHVADLREAGRDPLSFSPLPAAAGLHHVLLAPRDAAKLASGDPDGSRGQVARLKHVLAPLAARAGTTVMADAAAGHAAWIALDEMGAGLDRLITVGTPLTAAQAPRTLTSAEEEVLSRLAEFLPAPDPAEPDDAALALARSLLAPRAGPGAAKPADLALPQGWTVTKRASLTVQAVYGVVPETSVDQALTAIVASGLSLRGQVRAARRALQEITGAGMGLHLPLSPATADGALALKGHVLAELVGTDIDSSGALPDLQLRDAKRVLGQFELRRNGGWLIGGPAGGAPRPALELRALELHGQFAYGGTTSQPDRFRLVLHGVRIHDTAYPRLDIDASVAEGDLGIDGLAAASTAEIAQMLTEVLGEIDASADATLAQLASLLRGAGILGSGGSFDPLSLSRWTDNPAARLSEALANSGLKSHLMQAVSDFLSARATLSYAPATRQLTVALTGQTGENRFAEWALSATLGPSGVGAGSLRLGRASGLNLTAALAPSFTARLNLGAAQGGLPSSLSLWPIADISPILPTLPPIVLAHVLSRALEGLRHADATARPVVEAALIAFGALESGSATARVTIPPLAFTDPAAWLGSAAVLGQSGSSGPTLRADRVIALLDALKPLTGATGPSGTWAIIPGLSLSARDASGLALELQIDAAAFQPGSDIAFGGSFGLHFATGLSPRPLIAAHAGLRGGAAGTRAVHLTLSGTDLRLFLRPAAGADLGIYPNLSGLADLGLATVISALPAALDAIVAHGGTVGPLVADIGDALLLRTAPPNPKFDSAAISAWATDPAAALAARWPQLLANGLAQLGPLLPPGVALTRPSGGVRLTLANVATAGASISATLEPSPFRLIFETTQTGLPFVGGLTASIAFDSAGLDRLTTSLGPAEIPIAAGITLRPVFDLDVGNAAAAAQQVGIGLATDASGSDALRLAYDFDTQGFAFTFAGLDTAPDIAAGIMHFAIDLLGAFVIELPQVEEVLGLPIGNGTLDSVFRGVVLKPAGGLDPGFFQVVPVGGQTAQSLFDDKLDRIFTLIENLAAAGPSVTLGGAVEIALARASADGLPDTGGGILGLRIGLTQRFALLEEDIDVWIENDNRWIINSPGAGLFIGFLDTAQRDFAPLLRVDGLGLRVGRSSAPLLTDPIGLGSIALHILAQVGGSQPLGGAQVQLSEISLAVGGAEGGNPVAQGMLAETNDGEAPLAPAFSPALSIQTRPGGGLAFRFRAGDGEGPWWLPIRRQFGPLYVDQIGLGTQEDNDRLKKISLLFSGNVSIAGLTAAVDELGLTHDIDNPKGIFDSASWEVDLAGLAVSADLSGVTLAGGLRKFTEDGPPKLFEYIGMLNARFATYGLSIYGGYARTDAYTAFFAFGAVLGPFGGPPAFFLTGIGGGFGINREIVPPSDMSEFNTFPMLAALDPQADLPDDLMEYMAEIRGYFPPAQGRYWFAAGISFTSFALVDGVAVVAVEFGEGFELTIFGLARMALPRPEAALLSIELGLIARFSTDEGVLWIQAQLTDNSWLFHPSVRLTGGFAFVSWFKEPNNGQFVLTLGGYHPNFSAQGYPVVPRLGLNWSPNSHITIKAEGYYALTSEAMMAGGLFEASAKYGAAYAHLSFGGNAIVYFDPFHYEADAHARVSAGIRIETWLGTIKLSFSLGAWIEVAGPNFHGRASIEIGPIDITVSFGGSDISPPPIGWVDFVTKYLELAPGNSARALSTVAGRGALPPASSDGEEPGTADGSAGKPFDVLSEFELSLTTTIPINSIKRGSAAAASEGVVDALGLAPMQKDLTTSRLTLSLRKNGTGAEELDDTAQIQMTSRRTGHFPKGVWGEAPDIDHRKVPKGEVIAATEGVDFVFKAVGRNKIPDASTGGIAFNQVEAGPRKPLPLRPVGTLSHALVQEAQAQRQALAGFDAERMPDVAKDWRAATNPEPTPRRAWFRERAAPMRVGLLSERIVAAADLGRKRVIRPGLIAEGPLVYAQPRLRGMLTLPARLAETLREATTVAGMADEAAALLRTRPPGMAGPLATAHAAPAAPLLRADMGQAAAAEAKTLLARHAPPPTSAVRSALGAGSARAGLADRATLKAVSAMMLGTSAARRGRRETARALAPGELAVFDMPGSARAARFENAGTLTLKGQARLIVLDAYGKVLENRAPARSRTVLPSRAAMVAVLAGDTAPPVAQEVRGWTAGSTLAYLGRSLARCAGGFVAAPGASRARGGRREGVGWIRAAAFTDQAVLIETRFDAPAQSVALLIDGEVDEAALATLALGFEGAEALDEAPLLVPFDGKTLVVHALSPGAKSLSVHVGGLTPGRLDGVLAADLPPDRLVTRIVNETAMPSLDVAPGPKASPVELKWTKPADIPAVQPD